MSSAFEKAYTQDKVVEALSKYGSISFGLSLLGVGLILFGIAGLASYDKNMTGPPYFISGIVVGCLELLSAILCMRIQQTSREITRDEIHKGFLTSQINSQTKFSTVCVILSLLGILMALVGGFSKVLSPDGAEGVNRFLASVIVIGCVIAFIIETYAVYVANSYVKYFQLYNSPKQSRYRPGEGSNGYLEKNLNTYMSHVSGSVRQQFKDSVQQQLARQNRRRNIESTTPKQQQQEQQSQQQEQQQQPQKSPSQEQITAELTEPDNTDGRKEEINKPLLADKNNTIANSSEAQ